MEMIRLSLSEQLYLQIRESIILQQIPCGAKLTTRELQDRYKVSSTPVREALTRLAQEGLVEIVTNQGAKVIELSLQDMLEINDLSLLLDSHALRLALESPRRSELVTALQGCVEQQRGCVENSMPLEQLLASNNAFYKSFYEYAQHERLKRYSLQLRGLYAIVVLRMMTDEGWRESLHQHQAILDAVRDGEDSQACALLHSHFEGNRQRLINTVREEQMTDWPQALR